MASRSCLAPEEEGRYPEMKNLLDSLSKHINDDGLSLILEKEIEQAENVMEREKLLYLQQHILHNEIHEMLLEHEVVEENKTQQTELSDALRECLNCAEATSYLHPRLTADLDEPVPLLGLTKQHLVEVTSHMKKLPALQQHFIPEIENRLKKKCEEIASCHASCLQISSDQLSFAKASRLPDILKMEEAKLKEETKKLSEEKAIRNKQYWLYFEALNKTLELLETLITKHRLELQSEKDSVTTDWLSARCHAMHLKIRVFRAKLLCDIYSPEAVAALKQIQRHLKLNIHEKETVLSQLGQTLQSYKAIGMGFEALVKEYEQLQKSVANKKWALQELQQTMNEEELHEWRA